MKKISFILLFFLLVTTAATAQSDSLVFVSANWHTETVQPEVNWKNFHFNHGELFQSNQNISVLELPAKRKKVKLSIAYSDSLELSSQLAVKNHAIAGINGSYFKMRGKDPDNHPELTAVPHTARANMDSNRSQTYLKVNGKLITGNQANSAHVKRYPRGALAFGKKDISIFKVDTTISNWEQSIRAKNLITSGPMLVSKGAETIIPDDSFCSKRHPRTAVGVRADGSVLFVVVDGRSDDANGMNLHEMQKIMQWFGCVDALNLDGGGSSTMVIRDQPFHGVVNCPSDNKKFDHEGEREVANAILILKK